MTKHCNECKQALTFAERWGIRKHVCDEDILAALAYKQQEEHKQYLERKRVQQERDDIYRASLRFSAPKKPEPVFTPMRSSSGSSRRVSSSYDDGSMVTNFASSMSNWSSSSDSSSSYSSSCDSSSSSSDSGSCSSGD